MIQDIFVCLFVTDPTAKSRWALSKEAMPIANADRYYTANIFATTFCCTLFQDVLKMYF